MIKKISSILFIFTLFFGFSLGVSASEFRSEENPVVNEPATNLHLVGSNVEVKSEIKKDLVVAGGDVNITSKVERNILAAAGTLKINSSEVGGTVRVAGGQVFLSGNFKEDLIVAGGTVNIDKAVIEGDLIVASNSLSVSNSQIKGNIKGSYSILQGSDIKSQVAGKIELVQVAENQERNNKFQENFNWLGEFSLVVFLLILTYILFRNQKLETKVKFNKTFGLDILLGLGVLVLPVVILFISIFLFVFPVVAVLTAISYLLCVLASIYLPIYLANWLKNTFELSFDLRYLIAISYIILLLVNVVTIFVPGAMIITFVYATANIGYLARLEYSVYKKALEAKA